MWLSNGSLCGCCVVVKWVFVWLLFGCHLVVVWLSCCCRVIVLSSMYLSFGAKDLHWPGICQAFVRGLSGVGGNC